MNMSSRKSSTKKFSIKTIKKRFQIINNAVVILVNNKGFFEKFKLWIDNSKTINKDANYDFLRFIAFNYRNLAAINVCKQIDTIRHSESLVNLLKDIKENNKFFTLRRFIKKYSILHQDTVLAEFKKFSISNNKYVSRLKVQQDINELNKLITGVKKTRAKRCGGLKKFRNKRGAHWDKGNPGIKATLRDLNDAIAFLEQLVLKYDILINTGGRETLLLSDPDIDLATLFRE